MTQKTALTFPILATSFLIAYKSKHITISIIIGTFYIFSLTKIRGVKDLLLKILSCQRSKVGTGDIA